MVECVEDRCSVDQFGDVLGQRISAIQSWEGYGPPDMVYLIKERKEIIT